MSVSRPRCSSGSSSRPRFDGSRFPPSGFFRTNPTTSFLCVDIIISTQQPLRSMVLVDREPTFRTSSGISPDKNFFSRQILGISHQLQFEYFGTHNQCLSKFISLHDHTTTLYRTVRSYNEDLHSDRVRMWNSD